MKLRQFIRCKAGYVSGKAILFSPKPTDSINYKLRRYTDHGISNMKDRSNIGLAKIAIALIEAASRY